MILPRVWIVLFVLAILRRCSAQMGKSTIKGDKMSGTISMGPPDLTDEESQDNFMPSKLRCDACRGIIKRFETALEVSIMFYLSC